MNPDDSRQVCHRGTQFSDWGKDYQQMFGVYEDDLLRRRKLAISYFLVCCSLFSTEKQNYFYS
jgi:hypothetical protein